MISRFAGAEITEYKVVDFDATAVPVKPIASSDAQVLAGALLKVEGKVTRIQYAAPKDKAALEIIRNYEQALDKGGFKTLFKCGGDECGAEMSSVITSDKVRNANWDAKFSTANNRLLLGKRSDANAEVYALFYVMPETNYPTLIYQQVVEVKPMQTGQVSVATAATLKKGLDAEGKVAVYGVYFDTAKAEVKPTSKPTLDEMVKLLNTHPALKVYIVGHTDNAGELAANLQLSQRRAEAVVKWLVASRIDPQRLQAKGVASLAPVASNADEAGRARNRRVEVVLQ